MHDCHDSASSLMIVAIVSQRAHHALLPSERRESVGSRARSPATSLSRMSSLFLWLHIGFAIFTIGPLTAATMAAPRAIRDTNLPVLRSSSSAPPGSTASASLGVFVFGLVLGMVLGGGVLGKWYMSASMTLFIVGIVLLVIIDRDLRGAVRPSRARSRTTTRRCRTGGSPPSAGCSP